MLTNKLFHKTSIQLFALALIASVFPGQMALAQVQKQAPTHGKRPARLVIRGAMVVDGNGTPASGPKDIVIEGNTITEVVSLDSVALKDGKARRPAGDIEIDATGKYVLPGLINLHGHVQDERGGIPQPVDYCLKMWLACGITTVRDVGSDTKKTIALREKSQQGEVAAPRLFVYGVFGARNAEQARIRVRELKAMGCDGMKFFGIDRDIFSAFADEAHKQGLRIAHHAGVEEQQEAA